METLDMAGSTLAKAVMLLTWRWETEFGSWEPT
jgi:hypothetical protein